MLTSMLFWTALSAIGTISAVWVALYPIMSQNRSKKSLFENAILIEISQDGRFKIMNLYEEPIVIDSISQKLYSGKEMGVKKDHTGQIPIPKIPDIKKPFDVRKIGKKLAANQSFMYAFTKSHIEGETEEELVWVLVSKIDYSDLYGNKGSYKCTHGFSTWMPPRFEWVELIFDGVDKIFK
jgi:hypothetical protein